MQISADEFFVAIPIFLTTFSVGTLISSPSRRLHHQSSLFKTQIMKLLFLLASFANCQFYLKTVVTKASYRTQLGTALFPHLVGAAFNSSGFMFVTDYDNCAISVLSPLSSVSIFVGNCSGTLGADGQGRNVRVGRPYSLLDL